MSEVEGKEFEAMHSRVIDALNSNNEFTRVFFYGIPFEMSLLGALELVKKAYDTAVPEDKEHLKKALEHWEEAVAAMDKVKENLLRGGGYLHETKILGDAVREAESAGNIVPLPQ